MTIQFAFQASPDYVGITMKSIDGDIAVDRWAIDAPSSLIPGVDLAHTLESVGSAISDGHTLLVEHRAIAGLTSKEADVLALPASAPILIHLFTRGLITKSDFRIELEWRRATGAPVLGIERLGSLVKIGGAWSRLPEPLFSIVEAVEKANGTNADDLSGRYIALAELRELLPGAVERGSAETHGVIGAISIAVADSFSLDLRGEGADSKLVPVLFGARNASDRGLLSDEQQSVFGEDQFHKFSSAKAVYTLPGNLHVVLAPPLREALQVVRRVQSDGVARRRAFFSNPQAFLQDALGDNSDALVETLFRETPYYSQRVLGLGLWQPRVLPWIQLKPSNWFGNQDEQGHPPQTASSGLLVGDKSIPLTTEECDELQRRVEDAIGAERATVSYVSSDQTVEIPATYETLKALETLRAQGGKSTPKDSDGAKVQEPPQVLLIQANENDIEVEGEFVRRPELPLETPRSLASTLKPHQEEGLRWLQKAWTIGRPGVLLADDMGLGKSIQGLAFLAWLRHAMQAGLIQPKPFLIVAPTGLLENWKAEHNRHLTSPGLGTLVEAFGRGLSAIKTVSSDGRPGINIRKLQNADWVLTTYETLRSFDRDFGSVEFAALIFDEAQKIKTPGIRLTDAAKATNADFRIAMTGTPVENRLSDLWCITDAIHPAVLGDLKSFSSKYEKDPDFDRLKILKSSLDTWHRDRPPLLLRRLKRDKLPDIPEPNEILIKRPMPPMQEEAYRLAIGLAKRARAQSKSGGVLSALQELRKCSLHPERIQELSDEEFIGASARLQILFEVLDKIFAASEKALIFLADLEIQARLAGIIQRRYRLLAPPMIINGSVPGKQRQDRVDRFQAGPDEFDVMILSPQAGGVGLTLTRANHVIHLARWWNPAVEDQCTGRALRIGQSRTVHVYIPMASLEGETSSFDENLHALLERKRRLMNEALMPPEFSSADIDSLLNSSI